MMSRRASLILSSMFALSILPMAAYAAPPGYADPVPIPGGTQIPNGPFIHTFVPGPVELGFQGLDVEPSTITDFHGFVAMGYLAGTALDTDNKTYDMLNDIRVYDGQYLAADGSRHRGTFAFI